MVSANLIADEIARHCPNPTPPSRLMINDIPLVLWQVLRLAEDASFRRPYVIDNISRLVTTASLKLVSGGLTIAKGTLVRKVCGPILARYSACCVSRRFSEADIQRDFIRSQAQYKFCSKFVSLLYDCHLREEQELIDSLSVYKLKEALYSSEAEALVSGRIAGANRPPKVLRLGRVLFA